MARFLLALTLASLLQAQEVRDVALGDRIVEELRARAVDDPPLQKKVDAYVRKVARLLPVPAAAYRLEVIGQLPDLRDPVALPGGTVVVPSSALRGVKDDDAFARILAHAFGHLLSGHGKSREEQGVAIWTPPHLSPVVPLARRSQFEQWEQEAAQYASECLKQAGPILIPGSELREIQDWMNPAMSRPSLRKARKD